MLQIKSTGLVVGVYLALVCGIISGCGVVKDGTQKEYYDNGALKVEKSVKNFRPDGPYKEYYRNGKIKVEAHFHKGKLHGPSKAYNAQGSLVLQELYQNGEIVSREEY